MTVARFAYFVAACLLLNGCAVTSDGSMVLAGRGSTEWNKMAPPEDIATYYDSQSIAALCKLSRQPGRTEMQLVQRHIEDALRRRGAPSATCHPPVDGAVAARDLKSGA
jgi:hypothetical protein